MTGWHPGALLGLPQGVPDALHDAGMFRYLLIACAAAAGLSAAQGRVRASAASVVSFAVVSVAFWTLALGRPYGVLVTPAATVRAGDSSVAAVTGGRDSLLVGEPSNHPRWNAMARAGIPGRSLVLLPSLMPALALGALALAVFSLLADRRAALVTTALWVSWSTGDLDAVRGAGFLSGGWTHPGGLAALVAAATATLALARAKRARPIQAAGAAIILALGAMAAERVTAPWSFLDALYAAALDALPLAALGTYGLARRDRDAAALGATVAGVALLVLGGIRDVDPWSALAVLRFGLTLSAGAVLAGWASRLDGMARTGWANLPFTAPATGALVFMMLAGSFLARWDPHRLDPVFRESADPFPPHLLAATQWIRRETPDRAVFVAGPDYAPVVATLGARRVLRAPGLVEAPDDERRRRAERLVVTGGEALRLVERYELQYVLAAPGDFLQHGVQTPDDLARRRGLRLRYADAHGLQVYEILR